VNVQGRAARQSVKKLYRNKAVMATIVHTDTYTKQQHKNACSVNQTRIGRNES